MPKPRPSTDPAPDPSATLDAAEPAQLQVRHPRLRVEGRARTWWLLRILLRWGLLLALLLLAAALWEPIRVWLLAPTIAVAVVVVTKVAFEPWVRYRVHRWEVTEHATYATQGWWVREWRVAPTSRIQTVDSVRGPLEQLLGLATLRVTTASAYGAVKVHGLDRRTAEDAVTRLSIVAELSEGDAT